MRSTDHRITPMQSIARGDKLPDRKEITQMAQTTTPKAIAAEWGISAKTLRKFLRANARQVSEATGNPLETPGKGGRWEIPATKAGMLKLRKGFDAFIAEQAAKRAEMLAAAEAAQDDTTDANEEDEVELTETDSNDEEVLDEADSDTDA